ncbi:hypothetical protein J1N35_015130, partial [Gossypium stocksii]
VKEYTRISTEEREKSDDEHSYSMAFKAKSNIIGNESLKLVFFHKKDNETISLRK